MLLAWYLGLGAAAVLGLNALWCQSERRALRAERQRLTELTIYLKRRKR